MLTLGGDLSMTLNYDARQTSQLTFSELPYMVSMLEVNDIHPPLGLHCTPYISSYLGDDVMMLPQHIHCMIKFRKLIFSS